MTALAQKKEETQTSNLNPVAPIVPGPGSKPVTTEMNYTTAKIDAYVESQMTGKSLVGKAFNQKVTSPNENM